MTEVFAIYDKNDKLVVCFPTRTDAENYGKVVLGNEKGWEYCIRKMFLYETKQYAFSQPLATRTPQQTIPCNVSDVAYPFTIDYSKGPQAND